MAQNSFVNDDYDWDDIPEWDPVPVRRTQRNRTRAAKRRTENTLMLLACLLTLGALYLFANWGDISSSLGLESAKVRALHTETAAELIEEGILRGETSVPLDCRIDSRQLYDAYAEVLRHFSAEGIDLFWMRLDMQDGSDDGNTVVQIQSVYANRIPAAKGYAASRLYADTVQSVVRGCPADATDREKVLYVHDWIVRRCSYDRQGADENPFGLCSTAYACIVEGSAICSGYSHAFCVLTDALNVESGYVTGWGLSKEKPLPGADNGHAWNYVIVDGERLYVDVTWDDPLTESGAEPAYIRRKYCMITKTEMEENHVFR